jgi:hypothetical protein
MNKDSIILPITPQTWVRSSQGDKVLFRIPEDCRKLKGKKPCHKYRKFGECEHILSKGGRLRKKRLQRMNQYREDLRTLAKQAGFELPICGWSLYFYMPMPKRWKPALRKQMHGQLNMAKPDASNMLKIFEDSLSITDERMAQMSGLGKFWVDTLYEINGEKVYGTGWIEIRTNQPLYNPFEVQFVDQDALKLMPKRKWIKREDGDPKKRSKKIAPLKIKEDLIK